MSQTSTAPTTGEPEAAAPRVVIASQPADALPKAKCGTAVTYHDVRLTHRECSDPPIEISTEVTCKLGCRTALKCNYVFDGTIFTTDLPHGEPSTSEPYPCGGTTCDPQLPQPEDVQ